MLGQIAQQDMAPHRVADGEDGLRGIGRDDRVEEQFQVADIGAEAVDVPGIVLGQGALAQSLPAPVQRGDRKAALKQFADHLRRVLLDELSAPRQDDRRRARGPAGLPERIAQQDVAAGRQPSITIGSAIGCGGLGRHGGWGRRAVICL
jgi:hypothetical protein